MPNGHGPKEYGGHEYTDRYGTSKCKHGCGCWVSSFDSGGPTGLDPFGWCPRNPKDGELLSWDGSADYDYVVTRRIRDLSSRLSHAEDRVESMRSNKLKLSKVKLVDELAAAKAELKEMKADLGEKNRLLAKLRRLIGTDT